MLSGDEPGRRIYLKSSVVIGRGESCDAIISDGGISRRHAKLHRDADGHYAIEDLGSRNGTRVNGRIVQKSPLSFGDEISLGEMTVLSFTRREQFEDRLLLAQKMQALGQLAGGVAHDFNNILGALFANVTFLGIKQHDEETTRCLTEMEAAVRRAVDLTRQLSEFGRQTTSEHRSVRLADVVEEAVNLLRRTLPRNVQIEVDVPQNLQVIGDASRLSQVVMNLSINAKDAMPRGGTLTIQAEEVQPQLDISADSEREEGAPTSALSRQVLVTFTDSGLGMDAQTKARIFEPFFTTKPRGRGTGLGLATVQAILRDHGAAIEVDSQVGRGTSFRVRLRSAGVVRAKTQVNVAPVVPLEQLRGVVLVADDDYLVRNAIARVIERSGCEVISAADGGETLRYYAERASEIQLVVLDLDMPRIDGEGVLRVLRSFECDLPVLVVSGHTDPAREKEVRALGISEFLPKPFDANALLDAVRRHLSRP